MKKTIALILILVVLVGMQLGEQFLDKKQGIDRSVKYQVYAAKQSLNRTQDHLKQVIECWEELPFYIPLDKYDAVTGQIQTILSDEAHRILTLDVWASKIELLNPEISIDISPLHAYLYELDEFFGKHQYLTDKDIENLNRIADVGVSVGLEEFYVQQNVFGSLPNEVYLEGFKEISQLAAGMSVGEGEHKSFRTYEVDGASEQQIETLMKTMVTSMNSGSDWMNAFTQTERMDQLEFLYEHVEGMDDEALRGFLDLKQTLDGGFAEGYAATLLKSFKADPKRFIALASALDFARQESIQSHMAYSAQSDPEDYRQALFELDLRSDLNQDERSFLDNLKDAFENFSY